MLDCLTDDSSGKSPIVVIDAGIAASDNLEYLRQAGYDYICVARNQPIPQELIEADQLIDIRNKGNNPIRVQMFAQDRENILFCHSARMEDKERAMQAKFCARFEAELKHLNDMLSSRHGRKKYSYVQDQVSRLKERYKSVSRFYEIAVSRKEDTATEISIVCSRQAELDDKYSGSYFLRTSLMDLDEQKIWELYMMLNTVESAFRTLKSELDFRPVYHQKERRAEAHLFIAVLAYHIVNAIQHRLQESGIRLSWSTLRKMMRNHQIVLTTMQTKDGWLISILDSTIPEDNHLQIYNALGIGSRPIKRKLTKSKVV
jgi:transposase